MTTLRELLNLRYIEKKLRFVLRFIMKRAPEDQRSVRVHKLIAAAGSPVFQAMLLSEKEAAGEQILEIPKISFAQLQAVVQILYLGTTDDPDVTLSYICEEFQIIEGIRYFQKCQTDSLKTTVQSSSISNGFTGKHVEGNSKITTGVKTEFERQLDSGNHDSPKAIMLGSNEERVGDIIYNPSKLLSIDDGCETSICSVLSKQQPANNESKSVWSKGKNIKPIQRDSGGSLSPSSLEDGTKKKLRGSMSKKCKTCNIQFETVEDHKRHRADIHANNSHRCAECGIVFKRPKQLVAHKVSKHYKEGMKEPGWYHCKVEGCGYKSIYTSSVDSHYNHHHMNEDVVCDICGNKYQSKYCLTAHKRQVHRKKSPAFCTTCRKTFKSDIFLKSHMRRVHEQVRPYLCEKCPYRGFDNTDLQRHMFKKHRETTEGQGRERYQCSHCSFSDISYAKLSEHIERHNPKQRKCTVCEKDFSTTRDLRGHVKNVHASDEDQVWIRCQYEGCTYSCKARYGQRRLREHTDRIHERRNYKPWTCTECSYRTNVKGNLRLHMKNVHGLKLPSAQHLVDKLPNHNQENAVTQPQAPDNSNIDTTELLPVPLNVLDHSLMPDDQQICVNIT